MKENRLNRNKIYESALARKQIPLRSKHHIDIHKGLLKLDELEGTYVHKEEVVYKKDTK